MLKVKDNVDLKELEKFGFIGGEPLEKYYEKFIVYTEAFKYKFICKIKIYTSDREIELNINALGSVKQTIPLDAIYDLIQAGLVEKI